MNPRYPRVAQRAGHHCEYCGAPEAVFNFAFEVEHVVPPIRGGIDEESNWALSCRSCNLHKHVSVEAVDPQTKMLVGLYHPRGQRWADHFRVDVASGSIVALTAVARATVNCLRMNSPAQLAARKQWMRLRLFPRL
jgi:hypothetical protein